MKPKVPLIERLSFLLRRYNRLVLRHSRVSLPLLPLTTTLQFEGHPLRSVITPPVTGDAAHRRYIYDAWLFPLTEEWDGTTTSEQGVREVADREADALLAFMQNAGGKAPDFYEATVRLLYALGNTEGATMEITDNTLLVTHDGITYGIKAGTTVARFASGIELGKGNPQEILNRVEKVEMGDPLFALLYREAYLRGKHVVHALTALRTGNPNFDFKRLVGSQPRRTPTTKKLKLWESILLNEPDPLSTLYRKLVPTWITRADFNRYICQAQRRSTDPSYEARIRFSNKLYMYFNPQGKEQK